MSTPEFHQFQNTELSIETDDIQFIHATTGRGGQRSRRGSYRFGAVVRTNEGDRQKEIKLRITLTNPGTYFGLEHIWELKDEEYVKPAINKYLRNNVKLINGKYKIKDQSVFEMEAIEEMKRCIVDAIEERENWTLKSNGVMFYHLINFGNMDMVLTDRWE